MAKKTVHFPCGKIDWINQKMDSNYDTEILALGIKDAVPCYSYSHLP